jgi:hypothetical protein
LQVHPEARFVLFKALGTDNVQEPFQTVHIIMETAAELVLFIGFEIFVPLQNVLQAPQGNSHSGIDLRQNVLYLLVERLKVGGNIDIDVHLNQTDVHQQRVVNC